MSRFLGKSAAALRPYVPGEQTTCRVRLNTNESPYPPSPAVREALQGVPAEKLRLYPDPLLTELRNAVAEQNSLKPENVFIGGGSDEILGYAFMAFFDRGDRVYYPDITYGFYDALSALCGLKPVCPALDGHFELVPEDYVKAGAHIVLANPNAPTGIALQPSVLERIAASEPDRLLLVDEAYTDFTEGLSALPLIKDYDNILIVRTYSKSYALAGMRIGCAFGAPELICALRRVKFAFNPYNLDHLSIAAAIAATRDRDYLESCTARIRHTREKTREGLTRLGFEVLPSEANFLFARHGTISGESIYTSLKECGILVRRFDKPRIGDYLRISIGTPEEMDILLTELNGIIKKPGGH